MGNKITTNKNIDKFFEQPQNESLCCFVTKDFTFSGPVQDEFRKRFCSTGWLIAQNGNVGDIIAVNQTSLNKSYYIYYMIVKPNNYSRATTENLRSTIDKVLQHAQTNNVSNISVPDNMYSEISSETLNTQLAEAFTNSNINYTIYALRGF